MEMKRNMRIRGLLLLLLPPLWAALLRDVVAVTGTKITGMPIKLKVSQGQPVKLNCSLEGMEDPEMLWIKDGAVVQSVDQVYIPVDEEHWIGFLSLKSVDRADSGKYWCQIETKGKKKESQQVWLIVEGLCSDHRACPVCSSPTLPLPNMQKCVRAFIKTLCG